MYVSPKRLRRGSKVALVAPASPFKSDELIAGLDIIKSAGLEPVLGFNVTGLGSADVHSAPALERAEELMWAFTEPGIDAVITVTGGLGSGETLPYLDFDKIRQSRRCLIGLSDITALNNGILTGAGLISINGQYPSIRIDKGAAIREADSESMLKTLEYMMSSESWGERPILDLNQYLPRTVSPGKASGHIIGGNLDTLCTLLGTPYFPDADDAILFIEDVHKDGEFLARLLIHMKLAGIFDRVAGVVIGEFVDVPIKVEAKVPSIEDVIKQYFGDGVPCLYGFSFSHGPHTIPVPIGAQCAMDADTGRVSFNFTMGRS